MQRTTAKNVLLLLEQDGVCLTTECALELLTPILFLLA
ncbi:hypothetical protein NSP_29020 [Nodularia spumigena CCY9414]|nr:hypothetical protein NSP_29020 [Nodularia spumigena CCY9414]